MKTLYLLRHAKSDSGDATLDDHERPLAPRGERACEQLGAFLAASHPRPEVALCSTARRAVDTLTRVSARLETPPEVRLERGLYLASSDTMLERLSWLEPEIACVLVVGHNPGVHQLAADLAGRGDPDTLERLAEKFSTAGLAALRLPVESWAEVELDRGELLGFVLPRDLPEP